MAKFTNSHGLLFHAKPHLQNDQKRIIYGQNVCIIILEDTVKVKMYS